MDFHTLSRRELQTLCKRNKIPANMTNVAMADALSALPNVEGLDDFRNAVTTGLETPLTSRRTTTTRKTTKSQSNSVENESEVSAAKTRTRRATTRKILQEDGEEEENKDGPKDSSEVQSIAKVPKTPAARTTRKKAAATSAKEEQVVPRAYSTRRSTRLQQSEPTVSESVEKKTGSKNDAIMIDMLSEEETDESKSEVTNEGINKMVVLDANQDDLAKEDDSSTVVIAESASSNKDVASASISMEKVENAGTESITMEIVEKVASESITLENVEYSNGDQELNSEPSLAFNSGVKVQEIVEVSLPLVEETKNCVTISPSLQDEDMNNVEEEDESSLQEGNEVKSDVGVMETEESKKIADVVDEPSLLSLLKEEEKIENQELAILSAENELCDVEVEEPTFDLRTMKESLPEFTGEVGVEKSSIEVSEADADFVSMTLKTSFSIQIEAEDSVIADEQKNQVVEMENSEPTADTDADGKFGSDTDVDEDEDETPSVLDEEWPESDMEESIEEESTQKLSPTSGIVEEQISEVVPMEEIFSSSSIDYPMNTSTPKKAIATENNIQITPLKSSCKKKATTTPKSFIKVLDDSNENNESAKVISKSNSKVKMVVAEEKENNGENTAQRKVRGLSMRQLKKQLKEISKVKQVTKELSKIKITDHDTKTDADGKLQLENKRPALQTLNGNSMVGGEEN